MPRPLVGIGLPVYNGMPHLPEAVETLLAQAHEPFELLLCDNASTDGTREFCERLAASDGRVRYLRQRENLGALPNFLSAVEHSRGELFMWAAHDDRWPANYVATLAAELSNHPSAVLATPRTEYFRKGGATRQPPDRAATGGSPLENLRIFFEDAATSWIYGLYRRDWLLAHRHELLGRPTWGGDVLFLTSLLLQHEVCGSDSAVIRKQIRTSSYAPRTALDEVRFYRHMQRELVALCRSAPQSEEFRREAERLALRYCYGVCIRRRSPIKTALRAAKFALLGPFARAA